MDDKALWICELDEERAARFASLSVAATVLIAPDGSANELHEVLDEMNTFRAECVVRSLERAVSLCQQQAERAERLGELLHEMAHIAGSGEHVHVPCPHQPPAQRQGE